jgi:hydrogenase-4 component B
MTPGVLLMLGLFCMVAGIAAFRSPRVWLGFTTAGGAAGFVASLWILISGVPWEWRSELAIGGEALHLRLDALGAWFLTLVSLLGSVVGVYATAYWSEKGHPRSARTGRAWWNTLLLSMALVLCSSNGLHFLIAWELFAVSGYFLITLERWKPKASSAGWLYLGASHAGTLCLFALFAALAAQTGSWELGSFRDQAELAPLFWLALAGFGVKAGLFPLHIWLPSAHANAPSHVSAILSGVAIKMGIFGLVRFSGWLPPPPGAGWALIALGIASSILGVAFALGQHDLKRLLAYHSVENIGIILLGLGFGVLAVQSGRADWGALAFAGSLLHVWNHALFKALLFLGAGSVLHATGTRHMSRLGGLWRGMPWTTACFALGAAAISGLPPLNGFVSEWLVYLGMFGALESQGPAAWVAVPGAVALVITGGLAVACFVKVVGVVFLGAPRSDAAARANESPQSMLGPMALLVSLCVFIGVLPVFIAPLLEHVTVAWQPGPPQVDLSSYLSRIGAANMAFLGLGVLAVWGLRRRTQRNGVRHGPTWDCGYAAPDARMQYTAGSFASITTGWFGWILRPERRASLPEGLFPAQASYTERTPETVLEKVVAPAGGFIMLLSAAARRRQHGRVQAYILYLVLGLAALALLAWIGGSR